MKLKRLAVFFLAAIMTVMGCAAILSAHPWSALAAEQDEYRYFYDQLVTSQSKLLYDAMYKMYTEGYFKTSSDLELTREGGEMTSDEVAQYMLGRNELLKQFGAARDAFYLDHPGIFYVDFSALSIRTTLDSSGQYHAYLGAGRRENYYTQGITGSDQVDAMVREYEDAVNALVRAAKAEIPGEVEDQDAALIGYLHDHIINNTSYHLEDTCKSENIGFIRTAYGSLVAGEAVCEGYSRAMKAALDQLGIPCVLVQGLYRHTESVVELHMWVNVQHNGQWYAIDATMDDPYPVSGSGVDGVDGYENQQYLLVGETTMSAHHIPTGIISSANYEFTYPTLARDSLGTERTEYNGGLSVAYNADGTLEGVPAGEYWISFNGMGYATAAQQGYYMLSRFYKVDSATGEWTSSDWAYIEPQYYNDTGIKDSDTALYMLLPQVEYLEFGVTDVAPKEVEEDQLPDLFYHGDPFLLVASTGMLHNATGTYQAPPYIKTASPSQQGRVYINDGKQHFVITYDDVLVRSESEEPGITVSVKDYINGELTENSSGVRNSRLENFQWDGESTISFDFTPSQMWEDDSLFYYFSVTGLVGEQSGKVPNSAVYLCSYRCAAHACYCLGYDWNLFGKPALMENFDMDVSSWETSDNAAISEQLKHRMVLVATSPTSAQENEMNSVLASAGEMPLKTEMYNINLTVCRSQVVKTGEGVRVSLGFPEGYGPEDAGVTFKAYHFIKNDAGEIVDVEEIPCVITPYGLLITCKSFSPFAIAAVAADPNAAPDPSRTVILSSSPDGTITGADSIFTLAEGQSQILTVKANDGYVIDTITVGGAMQIVTSGSTEMSVTVNYSDLQDTTANIVDATFVAESVQKQEEEKGETVAQPIAEPANIAITQTSYELSEGDTLEITAQVSGGEQSYQWYKDGVPLSNQTSNTLKIDSVTKADAGNYQLVVQSFVGVSSARAEGPVCEVSILSASESTEPTESTPPASGATDPTTAPTTPSQSTQPSEEATTPPTTAETKPSEAATTAPTTAETKPSEAATTAPTTAEAKPDYQITQGASVTWTKGSGTGLTFRGSSAKVTGVKINNVLLSAEHYTIAADGTVTLKSSILDTLATGTHTITLVYPDGEATAEFKIAAASSATTAPSEGSKGQKDIPKTGDTAPIGIWIAALVISFVGILVCIIFLLAKNLFYKGKHTKKKKQ